MAIYEVDDQSRITYFFGESELSYDIVYDALMCSDVKESKALMVFQIWLGLVSREVFN